MKLKSFHILLVLIAAVAVVSCASGPKPEMNATGKILPDTLIQARKSAQDYRAKSLEIKADVAAKDVFTQGDTAMAAGKTLEDSADFNTSTGRYNDASALFQKSYTEAAAKKDAAVKAMSTAETERKASEQALIDADAAQKTATGKGDAL